MDSISSNFHFEDLIIKTIKERKDLLVTDAGTQSLLKFLVEIRESARKNENYSAYEHITTELQALGIDLKEETRIKHKVT
jgi:cysteinyl-tRNA synthetase